MVEIEHAFAAVDGVRLHYAAAGDGPLVVLLHGFPECWRTWRPLLPTLAGEHRVVAPDLRGFGRSDKPEGVSQYRLHRLTGDVAGLIEHCGADRAAVVGHDVGGGVAWRLPVEHPDAVERVAVLNAPHPGRFPRVLWRPRQLRRSLYGLFFQLPALPERALRADGFARVRRLFDGGPFDEEDVERYVAAIAEDPTAALNVYRALRYDALALVLRPGRIEGPALLVWGERDPWLDVRNTGGLERWVPEVAVERLPDAGHWPHREAPDRVAALLRGFLNDAE